MWTTIYSTGVKEFDEDHEHIDGMIGLVARAGTLAEEKKHLVEAYALLVSHIQHKEGILGEALSDREREQDSQFLREVRERIKERENEQIPRQQLITDLRHLLMVHAMAHETREKEST